MGNKQSYSYEQVFDQQSEENETISVTEFMRKVEDYGEWKELVGFLKGKNLNPKLVRKYIEAVLEIEKQNA
jgi:hypothetical protein